MIDWPLILLGGLLGSSHCVGMCGGFAILVGMHTQTFWQNLRTQLVYSAGRIATYAILGATAGFLGWRLADRAPQHLVNIPAALSCLAGLFLIVEGLVALGFVKRKVSSAGQPGCLVAPAFRSILKTPGLNNVFSLGLLTGLLPCGLVYAFLALAASSRDMLRGCGVMAAFGAGTIPLMVLTGAGAMLLSPVMRARLLKMGAVCVVLMGVLTVVRGAAFFAKSDQPVQNRCPHCADGAPLQPVADGRNTAMSPQ